MTRIGQTMKRGSAEFAILAVLCAGPRHGYQIARAIEEHTDGELRFELASLYPLLYRMERRRWIRGEWEESAGGRRRRVYRITAAGKKVVVPLREQWLAFFRAMQRLAGATDA